MTKDKEREAAADAAWSRDVDYACDVLQGDEDVYRRGFDMAWQARAALDTSDELVEALKVAATAELYDPITGIIDADVLAIVQDVARDALAKHKQRKG